MGDMAGVAMGSAGDDALSLQAQEAATIAFVNEIHTFRHKIEDLLDRLPHEAGEARRMVTREWAIEPDISQLDTIVRIAGDREAAGPRRDLPRRLLMLRVLAERELSRMWVSGRLDTDELRHSAELAPRLLLEFKRLENEFCKVLASMEGLTLEDREFLLQVVDSLMIRDEPLVTAQLIGPRLEELAHAAERGELDTASPFLSAEEAALFPQALPDAAGESPSRAIIDAIALRSLIQEDLQRWRESPEDVALDERNALLERLQMQRVAYQVINERLKSHHEGVLAAGLDEYAGELGTARAGLCAAHLQLVAVLDHARQSGLIAFDEDLAAELVAGRAAAAEGFVPAQFAAPVRIERWRAWLAAGLALGAGLAIGLLF